MRRCSSTTELDNHARDFSPCWLPAAPVGSVVPNAAGIHSFRFQKEMDDSPGLSAATLRLALASAGAQELRVVHEMRECALSGSLSSGPRSHISPPPAGHQPQPEQQKPLLTKKLSSQHLSSHQHQHPQRHDQQLNQHDRQQHHHRQPRPLQGRFRSATAGSLAADAARSTNPVRAALDRAFPASPSCSVSAAAAAARAASAFSNEHPASRGQWGPAKPSSAETARPMRCGSDAGDRQSASGGLRDLDAAVDPSTAAWPGRRSRRGASSSTGGSSSISASGASSMSVSAEGSSSARSSLDHSSGSQDRSSLDGNRSASDASDRSERCAGPAALRAESMPHQRQHPGAHPAAQPPFTAARAGSSAPGSGLAPSHGVRESALMDADCCGDSGSSAPVMRHRVAATCAPSLPGEHYPLSSRALRGGGAGSGDALAALLDQEGAGKTHKWASLSDNQAAVQLFWRLNHARQTVDFVKRQRAAFGRLDKARMTVYEALAAVDTLREYEAALLGDGGASPMMGLAEHAFQTAEACRLAHPEAEWLQLAGLLHGLGKLLAHPTFGSEAQWAVCGESFPVGCQHSGGITASEYFCVNPDRRRRMYNTPTGMYQPGCGLGNVLMSWSGAEYLHMVLTAEGVRLPAPTLWLLRHAKFRTLAAGDYPQLLDDFDRSMVPWLQTFQGLSAFNRAELPGRMHGRKLQRYYADLLARHLPAGPLRW